MPVEGKPTWIQAPDTAKGAHAGPESDAGMAQKLAHSIDATQLAQAPVATSSLDEFNGRRGPYGMPDISG